MKKLALFLTILFVVLTFAGAGYVLYHKGAVNAGYACLPMVFSLVCLSWYRRENHQ